MLHPEIVEVSKDYFWVNINATDKLIQINMISGLKDLIITKFVTFR